MSHLVEYQRIASESYDQVRVFLLQTALPTCKTELLEYVNLARQYCKKLDEFLCMRNDISVLHARLLFAELAQMISDRVNFARKYVSLQQVRAQKY